MLNTFSLSLIIWKTAIETHAQEMNRSPGTNWGPGDLKSSPTLEIIDYFNPLLMNGKSQKASNAVHITSKCYRLWYFRSLGQNRICHAL